MLLHPQNNKKEQKVILGQGQCMQYMVAELKRGSGKVRAKGF